MTFKYKFLLFIPIIGFLYVIKKSLIYGLDAEMNISYISFYGSAIIQMISLLIVFWIAFFNFITYI
jgi:hypothetical protein